MKRRRKKKNEEKKKEEEERRRRMKRRRKKKKKEEEWRRMKVSFFILYFLSIIEIEHLFIVNSTLVYNYFLPFFPSIQLNYMIDYDIRKGIYIMMAI